MPAPESQNSKMESIDENGSVDPLNSSSSDQGTSVSSASASNIVHLISQQNANAHQVNTKKSPPKSLFCDCNDKIVCRLTRSPLSFNQTSSR